MAVWAALRALFSLSEASVRPLRVNMAGILLGARIWEAARGEGYYTKVSAQASHEGLFLSHGPHQVLAGANLHGGLWCEEP